MFKWDMQTFKKEGKNRTRPAEILNLYVHKTSIKKTQITLKCIIQIINKIKWIEKLSVECRKI